MRGWVKRLLVSDREAFLEGRRGSHSVAGAGGGKVDTAYSRPSFEKNLVKEGKSERNRNLETLSVIEQIRLQRGNYNCI